MAAGGAHGWIDDVRRGEGPLYAALALALEAAIRDGRLHPGDRLPPQRDVAGRLGVDLTTVTRAFTLAKDRGLIEGAVGRGSFVRRPPEDEDPILVDLSMNLPPPPLGRGAACAWVVLRLREWGRFNRCMDSHSRLCPPLRAQEQEVVVQELLPAAHLRKDHPVSLEASSCPS